MLARVSGDRLQQPWSGRHIRMMKKFRHLLLPCLLVLAACEPRVHVDATADAPARFSSVLVRVEQVWFNTSATAVASDDTWHKFNVRETLDLVDLSGGVISRIADDLDVPVDTYRQVRVVLADEDNEVTWFDEDGDEHNAPLLVLNPDQGIGIVMELEVEEQLEGAVVQLLFDASRDLTEFRYGGETGFLLNPTLAAFDVKEAGTIRGTLNLSLLAIDTGTGRPEIQVTAQRLDEGLGRRVIVGGASVGRNGSFVIYPLPLEEDGDPAEYDLVMHGPGIETIVIRDVPVAEGAPDVAVPVALGNVAPVPAASFNTNVAADAPVAPRGARIGFYQTLPGEDEPHLIELATIDPLRGRFAMPVALSRATTISYRNYGGNSPIQSGTPGEGAARYAVAALSPQYGAGGLSDTLLRPATPVSDTATFSVPAVGVPASAVTGTISATITVETPGEYDSGVLIVSRDGAVVTTVSLDGVLQQMVGSTFVEVTPVPAGTASATLEGAVYHLEAWTWDSGDPEDTFRRHRGADGVDLRSITTAGGTVTIG